MVRYLIRRLPSTVALLFLVTVTALRPLQPRPGRPARLYCGKSCTPAVIKAIHERMELDIPMVEQYTRFVSGLFFGRTFSPTSPQPIVCDAPCLGYSYDKHTQVLELIARAAPVTF